jgi:hypothetical protein
MFYISEWRKYIKIYNIIFLDSKSDAKDYTNEQSYNMVSTTNTMNTEKLVKLSYFFSGS